MKRFLVGLALSFAVFAALSGCAGMGRGRGPVDAFTFQAGVNPGISRDVVGAIDERVEPKEIRVVVPAGTSLRALVATLSLSKEAVLAVVSSGARVVQTNGVTPNDFSVPVSYSITVTGDKQPWTYRVFVREAESNARLSALVVPQGAILQPAFSPTVRAYTLDVPYAASKVRIEARGPGTLKSVTIDGAETLGPTGATVVDFAAAQERPVSIATLAEDGVTREQYTVTIRRGEPDSNASLGVLDLKDVALSPGFAATELSYRAVVPFESTSLIIHARPQSAVAVIELGSAAVAGGGRTATPALRFTGNPTSAAGAQVDFSTGDRLALVITVTAEDQSVRQYLVDVLRAPPDRNSLLAELSLAAGGGELAVAPAFNAGRIGYTADVPYSARQVTLLAKAQSRYAAIALEAPLSPGGTRTAIPSTGNPQSKTGAVIDFAPPLTRLVVVVAVTAQDGGIQRYTLDLRRAQPDRNADLSSLSASAGVLSPAFAARIVSYNITIPASADSVKITVAAAGPAATIAVAEQPGLKPAASQSLTLAVAQGAAVVVTFVVSAEDGSQKLYRVRIGREEAPAALDGNALLQSLVVSGAQIAPSFDPSVILYDARIAASAASVGVTALPQSQLSSVTIDGQAAGKTARAIAVQAGATRAVIIDVTAQNGAVVRYTLRVTRDAAAVKPPEGGTQPGDKELDDNALLSLLKIDASALQPAFSPSVVLYDAKIAADDESVVVTATSQSQLASVTIDGQAAERNGRSVAVKAGETKTVLIDVKAQSGTVTRYTLRLTREKPADSGTDHVLVTAKDLKLQAREVTALTSGGDKLGNQARVTVRYYRTSEVISQYSVPVDVKEQGGVPTVTLSYRSSGVTLNRSRLVEVETAIQTSKGRFLSYTEAQAADAEVSIELPFLLYGDNPQVRWPPVGSPVQVGGYISRLPLTKDRAVDKEDFDKNAKGEYSIGVEILDARTGTSYGKDTVSTKPGQGRSRTLAFGKTMQVPEGATVKYVLAAKAKNAKSWTATDTTQVWTTRLNYPIGYMPVLLFVSDDLAPEKN